MPTSVQRNPAPVTGRTAVRYVALGDSYTIGEGVGRSERWPDQLVALLRAGDVPIELVANLGMTGSASGDVVREQLPRLDELRPDFISLLVGVNDVVQGFPAEGYRTNVARLLDVFSARLPPDRILTVSTPDYTVTPRGADYGAPERRAAAIREFNGVLRDESGSRRITFVDIHDISVGAIADRALVAADGLHPSAIQYARWVERIEPVVRRLLARPLAERPGPPIYPDLQQ